MTDTVDLFIVGGGINGAGIARDAAGRGLSVMMVEKDDLAEGTSSRSGKLVHGGLRYLEYYEFRLVREALIEREVLLASAPHIIWPMRFVLPHSPADRPAWLVRMGLFLYDHLGGRKRLPGTRSLDLRKASEGRPLKQAYRRGFEYSDCWVDDSRLVVLNALDAQAHGAHILTRTAFTHARRDGDAWLIDYTDTRTGLRASVRARALVNAAGPWVKQVIDEISDGHTTRSVRLVKGSHIITPKFWEGPQAYLIQNHDKRVIFINPYEGDRALIGTTDIPYEGRPEDVAIDEAEIDYLLEAVNRYFRQKLHRDDVLGSFSGVRPLYDDGKGNPSAVTRDYVLDLDTTGTAPLLHVFGGKITTFRKLAEHAVQKLADRFPRMGGDWTATGTLPGGDIPGGEVATYVADLKQRYSHLPSELISYYVRTYGTRTPDVLAGASELDELGRHFGGLLYEVEVRYLMTQEWVESAEDVLRRRTKHIVHLSPEETAAFDAWFIARRRDAA